MNAEFEKLKELAATSGKPNILPVVRQMSADLVTPVSAFLRLTRHGERAFFFESVQGGERLARFTFLGVNPFATLRIRQGQLHVRYGAGPERSVEGNPLTALQRELSRYRSPDCPGLPPFRGGAVGYIGYDCVRYLEEIPIPVTTRDEAHLMLFQNVVAFDRVADEVSIICNLLADQETLEDGYQRAVADAEKMIAALGTPTPKESQLERVSTQNLLPDDEEGRMGRAAYVQSVLEVKSHIERGDIFQCVLADKFVSHVSVPPFSIYRSLRSLCPSPYMFYLGMGESTLLGASPERLVKVEKGRVETSPIAGTRPRGKTPEQDRSLEDELLASEKERAEHVMLVDLGRNDVGKVALPGTVRVEDFMHVQRFSNVMHLVTNVVGTLRPDQTPWDALWACFPAGTLSGAPKIRAMEIIAEQEGAPRGAYGGAIIYSDFSGTLDSCITIRSVRIEEGRAEVQAGAGIVADSVPNSEYDEILHKSKSVRLAMLRAIQLAEGAP